jgi:4-diphosphocytidyl-2-C-methyl-D-erythritol kinase
MQKVSLFDFLYLDIVSKKQIQLTTNHPELDCGKDNLVYQAASLFFSHLDNHLGVKIHLVKRIPIAAGLGGGSSDAATTLLGLNVLFRQPFSFDSLLEIAKRLGSDALFFLYKEPAIVMGKGERVFPLSFSLPFWYVIVCPPIYVSTAWAYQQISLTKDKFSPKINRIEAIIKNLENDLEIKVRENFLEVGEAKALLKEAGAKHILMSGSGGSVFALFYKKREALKVKRAIKLPKKWKIFLVQGL